MSKKTKKVFYWLAVIFSVIMCALNIANAAMLGEETLIVTLRAIMCGLIFYQSVYYLSKLRK